MEIKSLRKNKKGSLQDMILILVILLVFSISILVGFKIHTEFDTQINNISGMPVTALSASSQLLGTYTGALNNSFLFLTIGVCLVTLVLASLVRIHPVFVVFYIIGWIVVTYLSAITSNIYSTIASDAAFSSLANQLTLISTIMDSLPIIIAVFGIILMIVSYKTWQVSEI